MLTKVFGSISLCHAMAFGILTFLWRAPFLSFLPMGPLLIGGFLSGIVFFLPFVTTFSSFGLNTEEDTKPSPETKSRLAMLKDRCPTWSPIWLGTIGFVLLSYVGFLVFGDRVNPFFAFSAAMSFLSGFWFVDIYPKARELFGEVSKRND